MLNPKLVSEPAPAQPAQRRLGLIFIIGLLSAFGPLSIDMYLPGLPSIARDLGGENWQVQLTLTACLLGLAGGQVVAGPLSDVLGRRRPLLFGVFIYALTSLLCAFAPSVLLLIVLRFIQGIAGATGIVIARAIVRDHYSGAEVARFFAFTMAINGLAPILAPIIGGQMLNFTSWRGVFLLLTAIGVILFVMAFVGLEESLPPERRQTGGVTTTLHNFRVLLTNRRFMGYAISAGLAFAAMFAYIAGSPFVLEDIYHVSPQAFSLVFAVNALGIIIVSQTSARLVGKTSPRRLLTLGFIGSALGSILLLLVILTDVGLIGILLAFFLVVASIGFISPNATALAMTTHRGIAGSASGLLGVLQFSIGAVVTPLVGIGGNSTALPLAIIMAFLGISAGLVFLVLTRTP
jgi:MFS transporter, DHA1 family, multidrug resistance protein